MPVVYRLTRPAYSPGSGAVAGLGSSMAGGRWNSKGVRAVYTSSSIALAVLELLVHASGDLPDGYELWQALIPDQFQELNPLPEAWRDWPYQESVQRAGSELLRNTMVFRVPSAVVPLEHNCILNPMREEFASVVWTRIGVFDFDRRLV